MKQLLAAIILSIVSAYVALVCYGSVLQMLLPQFDNVGYVTFTPAGQLADSWWFTLIWGIVPMIILLTWRMTKTADNGGRLLSTAIIFMFMIGALIDS